MKIATQLYGRANASCGGFHGEPIGSAELSMEAYERITGTGHCRGRRKQPEFPMTDGRGTTIAVKAVIVEVSARQWPGMGRVEKYRLVVQDLVDVMAVRQSPGTIWRDVG